MTPQDKIFVAGHRGLVGSAIVRTLGRRGFARVVVRTRAELDLRDRTAVARFYAAEKPDVVFVAAAKVGGIHANATMPTEFLHENLEIQNNVIFGAHEANVRRLVFLGSSCIYPRDAAQPLVEAALLTGPLEPTNKAYALAKIAGLELVQSLRKQYGRDYVSVMPTNLYGPGDNFDAMNAHVLPALIRRIEEAARRGDADVTIWGSGKPLREFLFSEDCADAICFLAERLKAEDLPVGLAHVNVGSGDEVSIAELARLIAAAVSFKGALRFDPSKPDGTPRKRLDTSILERLGWRRAVPLGEGIARTVAYWRKVSGR